MSDGLKGVAKKSYGPHGTGATGGPWVEAPLAVTKSYVGAGSSVSQNKSTIQPVERAKGKLGGPGAAPTERANTRQGHDAP